MTCDFCESPLADGYVPPVDWRGQPLAPTCRHCEIGLVYAREKRRKERDTAASAAGKESQA